MEGQEREDEQPEISPILPCALRALCRLGPWQCHSSLRCVLSVLLCELWLHYWSTGWRGRQAISLSLLHLICVPALHHRNACLLLAVHRCPLQRPLHQFFVANASYSPHGVQRRDCKRRSTVSHCIPGQICSVGSMFPNLYRSQKHYSGLGESFIVSLDKISRLRLGVCPYSMVPASQCASQIRRLPIHSI